MPSRGSGLLIVQRVKGNATRSSNCLCSPSVQPMASSGRVGCHDRDVASAPVVLLMVSSLLLGLPGACACSAQTQTFGLIYSQHSRTQLLAYPDRDHCLRSVHVSDDGRGAAGLQAAQELRASCPMLRRCCASRPTFDTSQVPTLGTPHSQAWYRSMLLVQAAKAAPQASAERADTTYWA
jgi:hypothetical protein